ncbi:hypothetical protein Tco_0531616 [Tanacetum coccineum]
MMMIMMEEDDSSSEFADVNKSSADDTEDNANDKDKEDTSSAQEEQNNEDFESLETPPIKRHGRSKKSVRTNENKSSSVKKHGRPRKSNDEEKKQTIGSQGKKHKASSKIRTRTTPTTLFNAMAILNVDRKKCLHEMGFGSMIGMAIHELLRTLGFYVIDNLDTKTNVLSVSNSSIHVTSESVHDILGIPIGGCSIESLPPRSPNDPLIKEWFSQFGEKTKIRPNDITDIIVSTKDAGKIRLLIMHQVIWGFVMTSMNKGSVLGVISSSNRFCPQKHRCLGEDQHCPSSLNKSTVSSFDNAILLWSPQNCLLVKNADTFIIFSQIFIDKFGAIIDTDVSNSFVETDLYFL